MQKLNFNFLIANFVSMLNVGIRRKVRFIKMIKVNIFLRLLRILYKQGVIRTFTIRDNMILVYFKYFRGRNLCSNISIVSKPSKRIY